MMTGTKGDFGSAPGGASATGLFALVLAAGSGRRFRSSKQLALYHGTALVTRAVRLAEAVCGPRTVLVAGHDWARVVEACRPLQGFFVNNTQHGRGMSSSIACGVGSVAGAADAVLLLLADQPLVTARHLEQLVATWSRARDDVAATSFAETTGPPVIFPGRSFAALGQLRGDRGARELLTADHRVHTVRLEDAAMDVDVPEDIDRLP
jgi:CTP:molybdopterin cytidylyltransferase MocA